jgi:gp32 DNA binding protein like
MASLAEIRAKLREQETKSSGNQGGGDNAVYPFWNLKEGQEALLRFLPDGDTNNTFFWVERAMIKLPFNGVKGETDSRPTQVQVPCVEMWGETCPVLSEVRGWFKDKSLEDMGRKYWKKRSYLFQGIVVDDPIKEENTPENPIRRFILGPQIFQIVRAALLDPEIEDLPTDYQHGLDFRIAKTSKGGFADYSTSKWGRRERALNDNDIKAINAHGLFNLKDYLPKKPTDVELKVIKEMFEASVDGEAYDAERWGQYYRAAGMSQATGDPNTRNTPAASPKAAVVEDDDIPFEPTPAKVIPPVAETKSSGDSKANDILSMIRARQSK